MKSYYLVFGASGSSAEDTANFLSDQTDIDFNPVGDFFWGWHFGSLIYVADNFSALEHSWLEFEDQEFKVIIYVQTAHGRSKDRLSMHKSLKSWLSQYDRLTFLAEEILEENGAFDS